MKYYSFTSLFVKIILFSSLRVAAGHVSELILIKKKLDSGMERDEF